LLRSGRLTRTKAAIGTVLRIKPLIQMIDGKLDLFRSARTHKKVINELIERIKETTVNFNSICIRILAHNQTKEALALKLELERVFNNIKISYTENLGPIFCLHLGKKGYGVSWSVE
ncbi:MAG: DegV family protein, partial [Candidatus Izimaplasma sp.]|nr:DegV family protein [Candidatus Izimaplasma bacterium]